MAALAPYVLIVDDDPASVKLAGILLAGGGAQFRGVRTAEEAISALAEDPFDLIVTDIVLPLMSGLTLAQLLKRRDSRAKAIPIVAMSAFDNASVERLAQLAGCVDVIPKPLDPDTFAERVLAHLPPRNR